MPLTEALEIMAAKIKILLGALDLNEALTFADKDINENWERYKESISGG